MIKETGEVDYRAPSGTLVAVFLLASLVAVISVTFISALLWPSPALAGVDNMEVDGLHGAIHVQGLFTEAPCVLDMNSREQQVDLGVNGGYQLRRPGDRGEPISFTIKLRDCLHASTRKIDERSGGLTWADDQPVVTITFLAPADADNPQLVQVKGIEGVGLRITDSQHRDIRLGSRGPAQWLSLGDNELVYYVTPERTKARIKKGSYLAHVNFSLNYD